MSVRSACLLAAVALVAASCGRPYRSARDLVQHGDEFRAASRTRAAIIEYRNAIRADPALADAHRRLADAYAEQGRLDEAYRSYTAAVDLDLADVHSRIEAGRLLFGAGRYREALVRAEQALERDERSVDAQILAGQALSKLRRFDEAIAQLDAAVAAQPGPAAYAALAEAKLASGDAAGAEASYRAGVAAAPRSASAHVVLARYLAASARAGEAEREYQAAVRTEPANEAANRAAASFYLSQHRDGEAEPFLQAAAAQHPQTLSSTLALADYYTAARRYTAARTVLAGVVTGPLAGEARVRLAAIEFETGRPAIARTLLDEAMKRRPTATMLALDAQLLAHEGKPDAAAAQARAALDLDPAVASAHYLIGTIALDRGHLAEAEREFREVLRLHRLETEANLQLARTTLAGGRPDEAIVFAQAAGRSADARLTLARAFLAAGQAPRARAELLTLSADLPTSADPPILLGTMDLDAGALPAARVHAERALVLAPDSYDALMLAARVALASGDPARAEPPLVRASAVAPDALDSHAMLAQVYASRGDLDHARLVLERFAARRPELARARTALGIVLEAAGRPAEARMRYEQALALDPREPIASNNLARIYASDAGRVTQAVDLARTAVAALPNDADAHDTLGWVAYRAGRLSLAASELERAVALNGGEPTYRTHLQDVRRAIDEEKAAAAAAKKRAAM